MIRIPSSSIWVADPGGPNPTPEKTGSGSDLREKNPDQDPIFDMCFSAPASRKKNGSDNYDCYLMDPTSEHLITPDPDPKTCLSKRARPEDGGIFCWRQKCL